MKNFKRITIFIWIVLVLVSNIGSKVKKNKPVKSVSLDFETGAINPYAVIGLVQGQKLLVKIKNLTKGKEYNIGIVGVEIAKPEDKKKFQGMPPGKMSKTYTIVHDKRYSSYTVVVSEAKGLSRTWLLPVETLRWKLAFSSAFVADTLTDPVFYLEPGTKNEGGNTENGFYVKENSGAKNKVKLGLAAMVHLYHSKYFGNDTWKWAPVTFGLGFGEGTKLRYYVGSSLKMGDAFFLSGGIVAGQVDRLPSYLKLKDGMNFTTQSNILDNLHTKTRVKFFLSLSYSFGSEKAKQVLTKPFTTSKSPENSISQ